MSASSLSSVGAARRDLPRDSAGHRRPTPDRTAEPAATGTVRWPNVLAFRDPDLERTFQLTAGRDGLVGYRLSCVVGVLLWLLASLVVPVRNPSDPGLPLAIGMFGALMNLAGLAASRWTHTIDRQNAAATPIAIAGGVGALLLAASVGVVEAYAASALALIGVYFFVARVRFVFATIRVAALLGTFAVVAITQPDPRALLLDAFLLTATMAGVLLGLFRMELTARRLFRSDLALAAQSDALARENRQAQGLLHNILPVPVADRLQAGEETIADDVPDATVLFADLVGFTPLAQGMVPADVVHHLDVLFSRFDAAADAAGVEKIKTIGDAYMAVGGIPTPLAGHPERVVALGLEMIEITTRYSRESGLPFALRAGVHTGALVAGVIGTHKFQYDLWGASVNLASRLESSGVPGRVQVSAATRDRLGARFVTERRGLITLKGVGPMETWLVAANPERLAAGTGPESGKDDVEDGDARPWIGTLGRTTA